MPGCSVAVPLSTIFIRQEHLPGTDQCSSIFLAEKNSQSSFPPLHLMACLNHILFGGVLSFFFTGAVFMEYLDIHCNGKGE